VTHTNAHGGQPFFHPRHTHDREPVINADAQGCLSKLDAKWCERHGLRLGKNAPPSQSKTPTDPPVTATR